jgi:hypothetical protein
MPLTKALAQAHLEQARANYILYHQLRAEGRHRDWSLTLLFYTALQLIQAYAVERENSPFDIPHGHDRRRLYVQSQLNAVWPDYRTLENASQVARYEQGQPDPSEADLQRRFEQEFTAIRQLIEVRAGFQLE